MVRSIEVVEDLDAPEPEYRFRSTASLLDPLSAPMLSLFRREVRTRFQQQLPRLLCGKCAKPVYVSLAGRGQPEERDGRDAFFAHHAGTAVDCEWGTVGECPRDIDRRKYGGVTEGAQHQRLKMMLASMLEADPAFSNVAVEHVISRPPNWRKPDVAAVFMDGLIAFDLQLATTQLPVIVDREEFYETNRIRYVWVTSTNDHHRLSRQSFQDTYWANNGQIFEIDDRSDALTRSRGEIHLWALSVAPLLGAEGLNYIWKRRLVARSAIEWCTLSGRPLCPGADFESAMRALIETRFAKPKRRLVHAVRRRDDAADAARAWDDIAHAVGAPSWASAKPDRPFKAIGVLATAAAGKKMDASGFAPNAMTSIFNDFLETPACRGWTVALQHIANIHGHGDLLARDTTQGKIRRNLSEAHPDLQRRYAAMLDIIFPKSALSRLSNPPTEIVEV